MNRFITVQIGARRNYAVPAILDQAGMLEALYTDLCADAGVGQCLDRYCPGVFKQKQLKRLLDRKVPPELIGKVKTCDWSAIQYLVRQQFARNSKSKQHDALSKFAKTFGKEAISKGLGQATHVFSMFGEGLDFMEYAKVHGLKTVTEIYLSPETHQIVQAERQSFPELEPRLSDDILQQDYAYFRKLCQLTDIFLVPSEFVKQGLSAFGVDATKCRMVPYAVGDSWFKLENQPIKGRILFVGTAELRKGIHILGQAAQKLSHRGYEFRVAGGVSEAIRNHPITQNLNFLGRVPRAQIQQEYSQADIFVLPSLAEGSAEVTYEALAAGVPVITTPAAGSVARHEVDGFIISEKAPGELADCIERVVEDRSFRAQMGKAARQRAKDYTWEHYRRRLLEVLTK